MQLKQQNKPKINLDAIFLELEAERAQAAAEKETRERWLLRTFRDDVEKFAHDKKLYREFMETFFYINPKGRGLSKFEINNSQDVLLDAYWLLKHESPFVRMNILKGRQQGMSTMIGAFAVMEMLMYHSTGAMIATENQDKSGRNIYRMYETYLTEFQKEMKKHLPAGERLWDSDITKRFNYGSNCYLANGSIFNVSGESLVTSFTLQFIHLSEAAFYHHLDDCLGMMLQTLPKEEGTTSSMFIETTAKMYGNEHHEGWEASCEDKSAFKPLFLPWYIHQPYAHKIPDNEREKFEASLGESADDPYGNEKALYNLDNSNDPWRKLWPGMDFKKYGYDNVTLENLKFRRYTIRELKGNIDEFNRQYPSTPDMAFLSKSSHVLDMESIRWYMSEQQEEPKWTGFMQKVGYDGAQFIEQRGGICAVWEGPLPHREYIIGVDVAEGFDDGDFSCAYVVCRLPFKIVSRIRGGEGRSIRLAELEEQLCRMGYYYNKAKICVENNGAGMAVTEGLQRLGYTNQIPESVITDAPSGDRFGWRSTQGGGGTRERGVNLLQEVIVDRGIGIPCEQFLKESHHFHYINGKAQAARKGLGGVGSHDDCVIALISALLAHSKMTPAKTEVEQKQYIHAQKLRKQARIRHKNSRGYTDHKRFV